MYSSLGPRASYFTVLPDISTSQEAATGLQEARYMLEIISASPHAAADVFRSPEILEAIADPDTTTDTWDYPEKTADDNDSATTAEVMTPYHRLIIMAATRLLTATRDGTRITFESDIHHPDLAEARQHEKLLDYFDQEQSFYQYNDPESRRNIRLVTLEILGSICLAAAVHKRYQTMQASASAKPKPKPRQEALYAGSPDSYTTIA